MMQIEEENKKGDCEKENAQQDKQRSKNGASSDPMNFFSRQIVAEE